MKPKSTVQALLCATAMSVMAMPAGAQDLDLSSRDALHQEIRTYILENPDIIREALIILEQRRMEEEAAAADAMVSSKAGELFDDGFSYVGGNPDGSVTVVEFQDYRCGYCKRAHGEVQELVSTDGDIRLIIKEFPILGEDSVEASRRAIATLMSQGPESYKRLTDALMAYSGPYNEGAWKRIARSADIDLDKTLATLDDPEIDRRIGATHALARSLQISGTPTFVIGGKLVRGYVPLEDMREVVRIARKSQN